MNSALKRIFISAKTSVDATMAAISEPVDQGCLDQKTKRIYDALGIQKLQVNSTKHFDRTSPKCQTLDEYFGSGM